MTLSDKIMDGDIEGYADDIIAKEDVKDFIKALKESIPINTVLWKDRSKTIGSVIDKLLGDKLI